MEYISLINHLFLFKNVDFCSIESKYDLLKDLILREYNAGDVILSSNEPPIGIGILVYGNALISTSNQNNSPTLRSLSVGDTFGAASLFSKSRDYSTTVISDNASKVVYISKDKVNHLCQSEPNIAMNYIRFLSDRVSFLNTKVSTFSAQTTEAKVAYYIYNASNGEENSFTLPLTYSQLADDLGIGRASLYRSLDYLSEQQIIERNNKAIRVLSILKLKKIFN